MSNNDNDENVHSGICFALYSRLMYMCKCCCKHRYKRVFSYNHKQSLAAEKREWLQKKKDRLEAMNEAQEQYETSSIVLKELILRCTLEDRNPTEDEAIKALSLRTFINSKSAIQRYHSKYMLQADSILSRIQMKQLSNDKENEDMDRVLDLLETGNPDVDKTQEQIQSEREERKKRLAAVDQDFSESVNDADQVSNSIPGLDLNNEKVALEQEGILMLFSRARESKVKTAEQIDLSDIQTRQEVANEAANALLPNNGYLSGVDEGYIATRPASPNHMSKTRQKLDSSETKEEEEDDEDGMLELELSSPSGYRFAAAADT